MLLDTYDQVTDMLIKPLKVEVFQRIREQIGVYETPMLH